MNTIVVQNSWFILSNNNISCQVFTGFHKLKNKICHTQLFTHIRQKNKQTKIKIPSSFPNNLTNRWSPENNIFLILGHQDWIFFLKIFYFYCWHLGLPGSLHIGNLKRTQLQIWTKKVRAPSHTKQSVLFQNSAMSLPVFCLKACT